MGRLTRLNQPKPNKKSDKYIGAGCNECFEGKQGSEMVKPKGRVGKEDLQLRPEIREVRHVERAF